MQLFLWNEPATKYALAGSVTYLLGCVVVTILFNVVLSNRLTFAFWPAYAPVWNACNHVRSASGILAAALFIGALRRQGQRAKEKLS